MIDRSPRLIARCTDTADVIAAVNLARETGVTLAVRGGGQVIVGVDPDPANDAVHPYTAGGPYVNM